MSERAQNKTAPATAGGASNGHGAGGPVSGPPDSDATAPNTPAPHILNENRAYALQTRKWHSLLKTALLLIAALLLIQRFAKPSSGEHKAVPPEGNRSVTPLPMNIPPAVEAPATPPANVPRAVLTKRARRPAAPAPPKGARRRSPKVSTVSGAVLLIAGIALLSEALAGGFFDPAARAEAAGAELVVHGPVTVTTPIDFGTVLPGDIVTTRADGSPAVFSVCLSGENAVVDYTIALKPPAGALIDMRPFMLVRREADEADVETDGVADGRAGDYAATASLDAATGDDCDSWLATLFVPLCARAYNRTTSPMGPDAPAMECNFDDHGSVDPQMFETSGDFGAVIEGETTVGGEVEGPGGEGPEEMAPSLQEGAPPAAEVESAGPSQVAAALPATGSGGGSDEANIVRALLGVALITAGGLLFLTAHSRFRVPR